MRVGHAAINAGADLMLHHAHILKGMEVYKGKVVVYSMCNFAMDVATYENRMAQLNRNPKQRERVKFYSYTPDPSYLAMLFLTTLVRA